MLKLFIIATLACAAQLSHAADAGKIIFVAGKADAGEQPAVEGATVQEGQMLSTGADGFLYVKTVDNGLFILRPQTKARIVTYHVDKQNPANTRIKLELLSGVARSKSGEAVKLARQNFRFNTPVAAIGVRGTDFTVFTDKDTSRVAVISGGVVVSGFVGACRPDGAGPCEGATSRELSAAQRGQLVQVRRGQAAPQLLEASPLSPDQVSPPRADEPLAKHGGNSQSDTSVEAKKNADLAPVIRKISMADMPPMPVPVPTPPIVVVPDTQPERNIVWGRWQSVGIAAPTINYAAEGAKNELIALNGYFALFRTPGKDYVAPNNGSVGFSLRGSEAYVVTEYGGGIITTSKASLSSGTLNVDFGRRSFATSMDLTTKDELVKLRGEGSVTGDGRLYGDAAGRHGYLNIQGLLSNERGSSGTAAYLFDGRIDDRRTVNGGTTWR
ncbi:FecR family protein [Massilia niastensis]|uniref:FecR family protein n=1 Tax=Massilia niastensis TaxID=544911 RepID=UPI00037F58CE|nr:FecR family protein [Massilia niastensis]